MVWIWELSGLIADSPEWFWWRFYFQRKGRARAGRGAGAAPGGARKGPCPTRGSPGRGRAAGPGPPRGSRGAKGAVSSPWHTALRLAGAGHGWWPRHSGAGQLPEPQGRNSARAAAEEEPAEPGEGRARSSRSMGPQNTDIAYPTEQGGKDRCKNRRQVPFSFSVSQLLISCPNFNPSLYPTVAKLPTQAHASWGWC